MLRQLRSCLQLLAQHSMQHAGPGPSYPAKEALQELSQLARTIRSARSYAAGRRGRAAPRGAAGAAGGGKTEAVEEHEYLRSLLEPLTVTLDEEDATVLDIPVDPKLIAKLNPELHEAMLAHEQLQRVATAKDRLLRTLERSLPEAKRAPRINKTSLNRLRLDELREQGQELGIDTRGTKEALVSRLLQRVSEEEATEALPLSGSFKPGVVSQREVRLQQRRQELAQQDHLSHGVAEEALRSSHASMVEKAPFQHVFSPQEVAELLAEARADDVAIIDVRSRCPFTDYFVLATGRSQRLVHMLASAVLHELKARCAEVAPGVAPGVEGLQEESEWLVVDAGSVVVHVFLEGCRQEYDLEGLWGSSDGSNITRVAARRTVQTLQTIS